MEGTSLPSACQRGLWFGRTRKQSPQNFFYRARSPLSLSHAQHLARLGVGKDDSACPLEKHKRREGVQYLLVKRRVRVFRKIQTDLTPMVDRSCQSSIPL